tara:strand:+ start:4703 stop:6451 length:1749 start_codon:yes stop_codon:yes gene_type:complete
MASLLGRADSTLAQMSYKEAMADVAPDLKNVYQAEVLNQALFQKGVEDHFDKLYADNNLLADQLKEATTLAMADLGTDYEGMELFNNELTSMKERMKMIPKGKKGDFERMKIRGELAELKKSTDGMEAVQQTLGTMIEAKDFDQHATGKLNLILLNAIASKEAKREIVNGKLFYSYPNPVPGGDDIKIDQQMLKDMLIQKDPESQSNFNKIHEGENALGKQEGNKFDRQGSVNKYETSFPSEAAFATNVNNKQGSLKYSFREALMGKDVEGTLKLDSIYETLMSMGNKENFFNGSDKDQDGDVDAQDFAHPENGIALIESLTDIHSVNFNYQVAKKVAAEFYADNISAKEFQDGVNMRTRVVVNAGDGVVVANDPTPDEDGYTPYDFDSTVARSKPLNFFIGDKKVQPNIGSLNVIRKAISLGDAFTVGGTTFSPDGKGGWQKIVDGIMVENGEYSNTKQLIGLGLGTPHPGFQNLPQYKGGSVDTGGDEAGAYNIALMDFDDGAVKAKIQKDYPDFTVNKNISGVNDAGVEVLEIQAPNGNRQVFYLQGENKTDKAEELKKLNDFIKEHSKGNKDYYNMIK